MIPDSMTDALEPGASVFWEAGSGMVPSEETVDAIEEESGIDFDQVMAETESLLDQAGVGGSGPPEQSGNGAGQVDQILEDQRVIAGALVAAAILAYAVGRGS